MNGSGGIAYAKSECPGGNWICSHMAAEAIYADKKECRELEYLILGLNTQKSHQKNIKRLQENFPERNDYSALPKEIKQDEKEYLK